jgi:tripartite-type tricarboxylate transporter receptor subunit TctC
LKIRLLAVAMLALAALPTLAPGARAQGFPARAVKFVVPSEPGGSSDVIARALAAVLSKRWRQPVVVENKPGAAGIVGTDAVAKSPGDGYTYLLTTDSPITSNPHLYAKLPYEPLRELAPVTEILSFAWLIVGHPSVRANDVAELIALAKAAPGGIAYGSFGSGSQPHIVFAMLSRESGAVFNHVPYKGVAPALRATLAGEVQLTLASAALARTQVEAGRLKAFATIRSKRHASMPQVPTLAETGFPDIDPRSWYGMLAPARTPVEIVERVHRDVAQAFADADFRARVAERHEFDLVLSAPRDFAAFLKADLAYKAKLIAISGAKAE